MTLTNNALIASTHDDFETWSGIEVGFDNFKNFVVHLEHEHYNQSKDHTYAIIDNENTAIVASALKTSIQKLPCLLYEKYGYIDDVRATYNDIEATFQEILELFLDCGAHYQLKR